MAARVGAAGGTSSARRRRERRQRSWWRHEQLSVAAALTAARHHSAGPGVVMRREEQQEGEVHEENDALRSQTTPLRGMRPGVPPGCAIVAASSAEVIDGSTLSFLQQRALEVKRKEEEEAVEAAQLVDLEEKVAAAEGRLLEVLRRELEGTRVTRQTWSTLSRVEQFAVHWFMAKDAVGKRRVKRKKKKKKRKKKRGGGRGGLACAGLGSCSAALHDVSYGSLPSYGWFSTANCIWQSLVLFCFCLRSTVRGLNLGDDFWSCFRIQRLLV